MSVLAALLAGAMAVLVLPDNRPSRTWRPPSLLLRVRPGTGATVVLAGLAASLVTLFDGTRLMLTLVAVASLAAAGTLVRRARLAKAAEVRRALVVDVCEALVGELRAGGPPTASLERCLDLWPDLDPVVAAARLGADVPSALRRLARTPGAEGLAEVASAWQVSQRTGAGLAASLAQVATTARARQDTRRLVQGELASAQATARLVGVLPVASLAMSAGTGADPWHFLLGTSVGVSCLGLGALCAFAGLSWIDRIAVAVLRP
jgi:tight adherence protein B